MAVTDAIARITQIQTNLTELATKAPDKTSAAAFAQELAAATPAPATSFGSAGASSGAASASGSGSIVGAGDGVPGATVTGQSIVDDAKKYIGVPYVFGGTTSKGIDCSGLVQRVLGDLGVKSPRLVHEQVNLGTPVASLADAKPGDLIITKNSEHIVIYAGKGMVIHAPYAGRLVSYQKNWLKDSDIQTIRRIAPSAAASSPASTPATTPTSSQLADLIASARASLLTGGVKSGTGTADSLLALIPGGSS